MSLRVQGLVRNVGALRVEAELAVRRGERLAITGPSGSGKTSLLRALAGLDPIEAGTVHLGEREITRLVPEKRGIGMVFQEQALFGSMSVLENAAFGLRMRGMSARDRRTEVMPWLERTGLAPRLDTPVSVLSGGERQRLAFVRALAWKPELILLDEPFSALDASLRSAMRRELLELHEVWPAPLILVTHDEADVSALATSRVDAQVEGQIRKFMKAPTSQR